jgi:hypothetical protein
MELVPESVQWHLLVKTLGNFTCHNIRIFLEHLTDCKRLKEKYVACKVSKAIPVTGREGP